MASSTPAGSGVATIVAEAVARHRQGDLDAAERLYRAALERHPGHFDALHLLGVVLHQAGRHEAAAELIARAIAQNPRDPAAHTNLALALRKLGRLGEALASTERALALAPGFLQAQNNRGNVLRDLGRHGEAIASYDRVIAANPRHAGAIRNRAGALLEIGRAEEAQAGFAQAIALDAGDADAHCGRGNALAALGRIDEALGEYGRALARDPRHVDALNNRGSLLLSQHRPAEALAHFEQAIALRPGDAGILNNLGIAQGELGLADEALASFDRAVAARSDYAEGWFNRGAVLLERRRHDEAAAAFARAVDLAPDYPYAAGQLLHARMLCCDWEGVAPLLARVGASVRAGQRAIEPFAFQGLCDEPADLARCAALFAAERFPAHGEPLWRDVRYRHGKIRVGYVCGEFREHATSLLMAGVWESRDRERFDIVAFDNGHDDGSDLRRRIAGRVRRDRADRRAGRRTRCSRDARARDRRAGEPERLLRARPPGVFARRPAPVQVNYLGFPGTLGAPCFDYIVADCHVIPPEDAGHYVECVVRLPGSYQANDGRRAVDAREPSRADEELPDGAFVFCCFNNSYKITAEVFDVWMRLLARVPGAVLWLFETTAVASCNLRREAERRGVAGDRLVFAPYRRAAVHLARHRLADLVLDTLPYNAHTTGSDALWVGVPIVTCRGRAFAGRVGASLLHAVGLPELVAESLAGYETLAHTLATDRAALAAVRAKLARLRAGCALFDTARFTRNLEAAFAGMWARHEQDWRPRRSTSTNERGARGASRPRSARAVRLAHGEGHQRAERGGAGDDREAAGASAWSSVAGRAPAVDHPGRPAAAGCRCRGRCRR
ncbi:MAG: tetratricopeptide repeat protein [Comamonadaceae bacterium]|nr:tetratricopeptide repeat protein [Comamonadaceae bacterium]